MIPALLLEWRRHAGLTVPPPEPIQLWSEKTRTIWLCSHWGPAVPYLPISHQDGRQNHGYLRLKGDPEAVSRIPETVGWPELQEFLRAINAMGSVNSGDLWMQEGTRTSRFTFDSAAEKYAIWSPEGTSVGVYY